MINLELVEQAEEMIRKQDMPKEGSENLPISTMISARMSARMGLHLENTCPYIRECKSEQKSESLCIVKDNYRNAGCYKTKIAIDALSGRFDSLSSQLGGSA